MGGGRTTVPCDGSDLRFSTNHAQSGERVFQKRSDIYIDHVMAQDGGRNEGCRCHYISFYCHC